MPKKTPNKPPNPSRTPRNQIQMKRLIKGKDIVPTNSYLHALFSPPPVEDALLGEFASTDVPASRNQRACTCDDFINCRWCKRYLASARYRAKRKLADKNGDPRPSTKYRRMSKAARKRRQKMIERNALLDEYTENMQDAPLIQQIISAIQAGVL